MTTFNELVLDSRAKHRVFANGCVKFIYNGNEISIAADGEDIQVFGPSGEWCIPLYGDLMDGILSAKELIDTY